MIRNQLTFVKIHNIDRSKFYSIYLKGFKTFNYLPFLLHNFTGFLSLDSILHNVHKGLFSRNRLFIFSGNVVKFEYKYKFDDINLRALKPKQNELYIYIDFGLKNIFQFNSKDFYDENTVVQTSDRVEAIVYKLDKHYEDRFITVLPYNKKVIEWLASRKKNSLLAATNLNFKNSKFLFDKLFLKNNLFKYSSFLDHLLLHFSIIGFYKHRLNNFMFLLSTSFKFIESFNNLNIGVLANQFFERFFFKYNLMSFGFFWFQHRVQGYFYHRHFFNLKSIPSTFKKRLVKLFNTIKYKKKRKLIKKNYSFNKKNLFFKQIASKNNLLWKRNYKLYKFLFIFFRMSKRRTFKLKDKGKGRKRVFFSMLRRFLFKINFMYFLGIKFKQNLRNMYFKKFQKIAKSKKHKHHQYDFTLSYILNNPPYIQKPELINNNLIYLDKSFLLTRRLGRVRDANLLKKRFKKECRFLKKKTGRMIYKSKFSIRNIKLHEFFWLKPTNKQVFKFKSKFKSKNRIRNSLVCLNRWNTFDHKLKKKKFSRYALLRAFNVFLSYKQIGFKEWLTTKINFSILNYLGKLPKAFLYTGFLHEEMYLYYKKFFASVTHQVKILNYMLRLFWLNYYLSSLINRNLNKTLFFKQAKHKHFTKIANKVLLNDYLIDLVKAFSYSIAIRLRNFDYMTKQKPTLMKTEQQKKMKFFWRTIRSEFVPAVLDKINIFNKTNYSFVKLAVSFLVSYKYFIYQKRFRFITGANFWSEFIQLKEVFSILFIKETNFNLAFYKYYYNFFFKLIKTNANLFIAFIFYSLKKANYNKSLQLSSNFIILLQPLISFLTNKANLFKFFIPFFFSKANKFIHFLNMKHKKGLFSLTHSYSLYKTIYNKLTFNNSKEIMKKNTLYSSDLKLKLLQPFLFTIKSLKHLFVYNDLLYLWNWTSSWRFKMPHKKLLIENLVCKSSLFFFYDIKSLLLHYKLKQHIINIVMPPVINKKKNIDIFSYNSFLRANKNPLALRQQISLRLSSTMTTVITPLKLNSQSLNWSLFIPKKLVSYRLKNKFLNKKVLKNKPFYFSLVYKRFKKALSFKIFFNYVLLRKSNLLKRYKPNKKRLALLINKSLFSVTSNININAAFYLIKCILNASPIFYKTYIIKNISILLKWFYKYYKLNLGTLRIFLFSIFHVINYKMRSPSYTTHLGLRLKLAVRYFFKLENKKLFLNKITKSKKLIQFLSFFTKKINTSYYSNIRSIHKIFNKQHFNLAIFFKNKIYSIDKKINTITRTIENENDIQNLFYYKSNLLTNNNKYLSILRDFGLFTFSKLSLLNLLCFNRTSNLNVKTNLMQAIKKKSSMLSKLPLLIINSQIKRSHFLVFLISKLLNFVNKKRFSSNFWLFNLFLFNFILKFKGYSKAMLYNYNFQFFYKIKNRKKRNYKPFLIKKYFFEKICKVFNKKPVYRGSRFKQLMKHWCRKNKKMIIYKLIRGLDNLPDYLKINLRKRYNLEDATELSAYKQSEEFKNLFKIFFVCRSFVDYVKNEYYLRKKMKEYGFRPTKIFFWLLPNLKRKPSVGLQKNSIVRILWDKGVPYKINVLRCLFYVVYSAINPLARIYKLKKKKPLKKTNLIEISTLLKLLTLQKRNIIKTYNVNLLLGRFFSRSTKFLTCITRKKKRKMQKQNKSFLNLTKQFTGLWRQRLLLLKEKKIIVRGDVLFFWRKFERRIRSRRFYALNMLRYYLTTKKSYTTPPTVFMKHMRYNQITNKHFNANREKINELPKKTRLPISFFLKMLDKGKVKVKKNIKKKTFETINKHNISKELNMLTGEETNPGAYRYLNYKNGMIMELPKKHKIHDAFKKKTFDKLFNLLRKFKGKNYKGKIMGAYINNNKKKMERISKKDKKLDLGHLPKDKKPFKKKHKHKKTYTQQWKTF